MEVASTITNVDKIVISMKNYHNHLLIVCNYLPQKYISKELPSEELSKELPSWLNVHIRSGRTIAQSCDFVGDHGTPPHKLVLLILTILGFSFFIAL
jgi:hypothetical protein